MKTAVVLVDIQKKFIDRLENPKGYEKRIKDFYKKLLATNIPIIQVITTGFGDSILDSKSIYEYYVEKRNYDAFHETALDSVLRENNIKTVFLTGLYTHACVQQIAIGLYERGYRVVLIEDLLASYRPVHGRYAFTWMKEKIADTTTSNKFINESLDIVTKLGLLARIIDERRKELTALMLIDIKKPIEYCMEEIDRTIKHIYAITNNYTFVLNNNPNIIYKPVGVVGVVTPFNNPLAIPIKKIVTAILCGNEVYWRPSPYAHNITGWIYDLFVSLGITNIFIKSLVEEDVEDFVIDCDAVSFTGSTAVGNEYKRCCDQWNIPFQGELGSFNATIISEKCGDIKKLVKHLLESSFGYAGQRCTATRIIFAHKNVFFEIMNGMTEEIRRWGKWDTVKDGMVEAKLEIVTKNELVGVDQNIFGPHVYACLVDSVAEGIHYANGSIYGLMMNLYSEDQDEIDLFLEKAEAGILRINPEGLKLDVTSPFGGWKGSQIGLPENGIYDIMFYTKPQVIYGLER